MSRFVTVAAFVGVVSVTACEGSNTDGGARSATSAEPTPGTSATPVAAASTAAPSAPSARPAPPEPKPRHCPGDMVLVEGDFCPAAVQTCLDHHPEYLANKNVSERCMRYQKPSKCLSKERKPLRFCIDRYEWPNEKGKKPLVLVQWLEARKHCESVGKRLCDEDEWLFACEGEEMLPYVYGYDRDPNKCLIDRPYVRREIGLKRYDDCQKDDECREHFAKLDQRQGAGAFPECVSPFGVYDMNGNANEWVSLPGKEYPNRSGLKGGWWGPVRCRCRPTVEFHKEEDWGYEAGFRCCRDAGEPGGTAPRASTAPPGEPPAQGAAPSASGAPPSP